MTERSRPRSDVVLERLTALHPKLIDLSLGRTETLLARLGHPEARLPPVVHVAGTNGKGSTVAFVRAIAEAAGLAVHVYTSPHLVRFHERIVLAGETIAEDALLAVLEECEAVNAGDPITYFEITTAAAFLAFSRSPADLLLLETGLGGRFDSTNVIARPAVTAITPVSLDHQQFLGDTLADIAFEKAGILKPGVPCIVGPQAPEALSVIERRAVETGSPLRRFGTDWTAERGGGGMVYRDDGGAFDLPAPALSGDHQIVNAGTAIAALRAWRPDGFEPAALAAGLACVRWPARLQRLRAGPLVERLAAGGELWLDGGHNPGAGAALAGTVAGWRAEGPVALVCAMQANKDVRGFLAPLAVAAGSGAPLFAVKLPGGSEGHAPGDIAAAAAGLGFDAGTAESPAEAVSAAAAALRGGGTGRATAGRILICGSLYLAGDILAGNG